MTPPTFTSVSLMSSGPGEGREVVLRRDRVVSLLTLCLDKMITEVGGRGVHPFVLPLESTLIFTYTEFSSHFTSVGRVFGWAEPLSASSDPQETASHPQHIVLCHIVFINWKAVISYYLTESS